MELGPVARLVAITLAVIGLFIYFGAKLSTAVQKHAPQSNYVQSITLTGTALFACVVGFWIICAIARQLSPESPLGAFLGKAEGVVAVLVLSVFFMAFAAAILEKLGYPITKKR